VAIQLVRDEGALQEELKLLDGRGILTKRGVPFNLPADVKADQAFTFVADGAKRFRVLNDAALQKRVEAAHEKMDAETKRIREETAAAVEARARAKADAIALREDERRLRDQVAAEEAAKLKANAEQAKPKSITRSEQNVDLASKVTGGT
jgi:hypothetical protein